MRLLEAIIAVLILASVLIVVYNSRPASQSYAEGISNLEIGILEDIANNVTLRSEVLKDSPDMVVLRGFVTPKVSDGFFFWLTVCEIDNPVDCNLDVSCGGEIFVENRIISSNLTTYNPKLVRIYVCEK